MGEWRRVEVAGHACEAFTPSQPSPHGYAVLYLHDEDSAPVAELAAFATLFDRHGLRCLAPITGRSWWTDRVWAEFDPQLSAEKYVLERIIPWLDEQWQVQPPRVALLGIGMGGQGALRLSYKHPNVFPIVAGIAPAIDYHFAMEEGDRTLNQLYRDWEQARQDTATLHIHPLNWPRHQWFACDPLDYQWFDSADRLRMKLYSLGVPYDADLETTGGGHTWEYFNRMSEPALQFIVGRLERERLRIV